jgi:hypothetical protein
LRILALGRRVTIILQIRDNSPAAAGDPRAHQEEGDAMMEHKWSMAGPVRAAMCAAVMFGVTVAALADDSNLLEVSVTNLMAGQTLFSSPVTRLA